MNRLTDDRIANAIKEGTFIEMDMRDLKRIKKPSMEELYEKLNRYERIEDESGCPLEVLKPNQKVEFIKDNETLCADVMGVNIQTKKIMIGSAWSFRELPLNQYKKTWWLKEDRSE